MNLTLLLATRGRDDYTIRFLAYANKISLKYPIYIADGAPNKDFKKIIDNSKLFTNISFSYNEFNDKSYSDYYMKIKTSISEIKTKYVMLIDNDDFVFPKGIELCLKFLNENSNYIGCTGRVGWFYKKSYLFNKNNLRGRINYFFEKEGAYNPTNYDGNLYSRFSKASKNYTVSFYSIFEREKLLIASSEICEMNFNYTYSMEIFFHLRMISLGKINAIKDYPSYFRQLGTSLGNDQNTILSGRKYNLVEDILLGRVSKDINSIVNFFKEKKEFEKISEFVQVFLIEYWSKNIMLFVNAQKMLNNSFRKTLRITFPKIAKYYWHFRHKIKTFKTYVFNDRKELNEIILFMKNFKLEDYRK